MLFEWAMGGLYISLLSYLDIHFSRACNAIVLRQKSIVDSRRPSDIISWCLHA